ncbi:MAG TPA: outer membrane beta-barrel protein [Chitinophagaceae bacterium]|nr:outer membrane beta-barrel protein [Chitinophagaceae bacterium]
MRRLVLLSTVFFLAMGLKAQEPKSLSLNLYGGYNFKDKVNFDASYGYINEAFQYGAGLEYFPSRNKSFELRWLGMGTEFPFHGPAGTQLNVGKDKGSINYILLGGNSYFGSDPKAKALPYLGAGLGVGILSIKDGNSATKFAWDAKFGVKIRTASSVSVNLHAYVQSIISAVGYDYYYYPGWGTTAFTDYASIFQFGLGGAICFNFKKK